MAILQNTSVFKQDFQKAHHIDAKCITGFAAVPSMKQTVVKSKNAQAQSSIASCNF